MFFETLLLATGNRGKYEEFRAMLSDSFVGRLLFAPEVGALVVDETGDTYAVNAMLKARAWARASGLPSLADDSGLEVAALEWGPGVRSARIVEGTDEDRNRWLLGGMAGREDRRARFVAALALSIPGAWTLVCEGDCPGRLAEHPSGEGGFGYDPLFLPDGFDVSFAALPAAVKNAISHRAAALRVLQELLSCEGSSGDSPHAVDV
ncbi:MAG: RdgB/HAM1 family non-canonical purine NTP pyrophosphatase [Fretibacterium sp.]|nr:RdgB/HAM1 family non-canonical purine NTP pyrophosphatase [Fretibacterium sp.]